MKTKISLFFSLGLLILGCLTDAARSNKPRIALTDVTNIVSNATRSEVPLLLLPLLAPAFRPEIDPENLSPASLWLASHNLEVIARANAKKARAKELRAAKAARKRLVI